MSDFERSGMAYDEPVKRRSPGTWFADLGDKLARGFNPADRPPDDEGEWEYEPYEEPEQPTAVADALPWEQDRKRFPTVLHGYDRDAVDAHLAALEREMDDLRAHRSPSPTVEEEIERLGEETSAILRVAHEQAAEITRRAQTQADRCVADAAANAVAMTEDAKRKLRQLDTETDAVWAERGRLIEDVRSVATSLFSLAEDAADRFPEDGDRGGATVAAAVIAPAEAASTPSTSAHAPAARAHAPAASAHAPAASAHAPAASAPAPVIAPEPAANAAPRAPAPAAPTPPPVAAPHDDAGSDSRPD
jgi:DivIVA domain-containing protein